MEYIWEKVPKTPEGLIHYLPGDIPYLYQNGFVDTRRFAYPQWKSAFEDCKQEDGSYLVSRDKFMSLRIFRYTGPVFEPFNPQRVREGEWTDENLQKLFDLSIKPSSGIPEDVFWNSVKALKDQGFVKGKNLIVDKATKTQLAYLIERFPSPRRRLEKEVSRIRSEREASYREVTKNRDVSGFTAGKLASESKLEEFKGLQSKAAAPLPAKLSGDKSGVSIKKLKKPTRKIGA
ncbi:MAG: hypothetical protein Q7T11_06170 [Deltaproteobacteria bacterium]|nr:hypothetical protein [Deltaproteobacteria bacterium]